VSYLRRRPSGVRTPKQRAGDAAEDAACTHLVQHGCRVIARNVRYREGELDVIAQDGATLVFVEVRLRGRDTFGGAAASVDRFKRKRLVRAAQHYLAQHFNDTNAGPRGMPPCRFDVITADDGGVSDWIQDAFDNE
jgi:putative endonuclease